MPSRASALLLLYTTCQNPSLPQGRNLLLVACLLLPSCCSCCSLLAASASACDCGSLWPVTAAATGSRPSIWPA